MSVVASVTPTDHMAAQGRLSTANAPSISLPGWYQPGVTCSRRVIADV